MGSLLFELRSILIENRGTSCSGLSRTTTVMYNPCLPCSIHHSIRFDHFTFPSSHCKLPTSPCSQRTLFTAITDSSMFQAPNHILSIPLQYLGPSQTRRWNATSVSRRIMNPIISTSYTLPKAGSILHDPWRIVPKVTWRRCLHTQIGSGFLS